MLHRFDLLVLGTGSAGASVAYGAKKAGWSVAIVDERAFGGTCALRGCDPKKVLVGAAELIDWAERMKDAGLKGDTHIVWSELMRFKRSFTEPVPKSREDGFLKAGITTIHGSARFLDKRMVSVGPDTFEAKNIVIATGAKPANLHINGEEHLLTSEGFLALEELPKRIVFVGGGYIAFEFAHIAARAGAKTHILQRGDRVLQGFEPTLVDQLVEVTRAIGVDVACNTEVRAIEKTADAFRVHVHVKGVDSIIECDLAVHAAGRSANIDDLNLEVANVSRTPKGVAVNAQFRSESNPIVYAAGDCADGGGLPLTPVAALEGEIIAQNLVAQSHRTADFAGLASIVYTIPSLGMTGVTQSQARERGLKYTVHEGDSTAWYSSRRLLARRSAYQILVEDETNLILGAHFFGPHTEELVNICSLAIRERIPARKLDEALFGYPTASSDITYMLG